MRVVQMVDSLGLGGAQKLLVTFAEAAQEIDLTIINLKNQNNNASFDKDLEGFGANVVRIPSNQLADIGRIRKLTKFLKEGQFDVIHTHLTYAHILGALAGRFTNIPVVSTLHNIQHNKEVSSLQKIEQFALKMGVDRIIAVGQMVADANKERFPSKPLDVIPNAVTLISSISPEEKEAARTEMVGDPTRPPFYFCRPLA